LGPLLFVVFINDITNIINSICKLFADDTKLLRAIKDDTDSVKLQQDIDSLVEWAYKWSLKFNQQKCKVMILGNGKQNLEFMMGDHILSFTNMEKDLGVLISDDLEWNEHVNSAVNKANQKLGQIKHVFRFMDEKMMKLLFVSLVRPHLEYASTIWNTYWQYDKDKLGKVQQRATRVESLRGYSYEERLKNLDLLSLENRRRRGDLIQMFKYFKGFDKIYFYLQPD
jgi:ribonuclease P/MRP protein subunit RPP40